MSSFTSLNLSAGPLPSAHALASSPGAPPDQNSGERWVAPPFEKVLIRDKVITTRADYKFFLREFRKPGSFMQVDITQRCTRATAATVANSTSGDSDDELNKPIRDEVMKVTTGTTANAAFAPVSDADSATVTRKPTPDERARYLWNQLHEAWLRKIKNLPANKIDWAPNFFENRVSCDKPSCKEIVPIGPVSKSKCEECREVIKQFRALAQQWKSNHQKSLPPPANFAPRR